MPFSYTSRKRKTWYLFEGRTKLGKPKYFLSQETTSENATRLDDIPDGHEVFEKPNGQVFCRKIQPKLITDAEVAIVEKELAKRKIANCIVERKGKDLIVHEGKGMELSGGLAQLFGRNPEALAQFQIASQHYLPIMLFQLEDAKERLFTASRWYFGGGDEGWFSLDYAKPLQELVKKYVRHIGKESLYELF